MFLTFEYLSLRWLYSFSFWSYLFFSVLAVLLNLLLFVCKVAICLFLSSISAAFLLRTISFSLVFSINSWISLSMFSKEILNLSFSFLRVEFSIEAQCILPFISSSFCSRISFALFWFAMSASALLSFAISAFAWLEKAILVLHSIIVEFR